MKSILVLLLVTLCPICVFADEPHGESSGETEAVGRPIETEPPTGDVLFSFDDPKLQHELNKMSDESVRLREEQSGMKYYGEPGEFEAVDDITRTARI